MLQTGRVFAGHQVVRLLGSGGNAHVYEVITPRGDRRALKVIASEASLASKLQARLAQEAEALAMIAHPNVVRLYGAGVEGDRVWLLLELIDGMSLHRVLARYHGAPPIEEALRWMTQVCDGLAEAHRLGIVHRDIKPSNIVITANGIAKVIDFGIARMRRWGVKTTKDTLLGTALYMPPEQLLSERGVPSPQWDFYALGLVLYEALAGAHPMGLIHEDDNMAAVCNRHLTTRPEPLAEIAARVPRDLGYVVERAIDAEPARRWSSMVDFGDALRGALQRLLAPQRAIARNVPLPNRDLALASTLPLSTTSDDFKLSEPAPSAPRTNDEATSSAAQPRRFWKTLTLTANEQSARSPEPARAEPSEPATVELPTRAEPRPCVANSPPDH